MSEITTEPLKPASETSTFKIMIAALIAALAMPLLTWYASHMMSPEQAEKYIDFLYATIGGTGGSSLVTYLMQSFKRTSHKTNLAEIEAVSHTETIKEAIVDEVKEAVVGAAVKRVTAKAKAAAKR